MPASQTPQPANKLLASLSAESYKRVARHLEQIRLPLGEILYHPGQPIKYVYFPHKAAISMVNIFENGATVEVGLIGGEGMLGTSLLSGDDISTHQAIVQIADGGCRIKASAFKQEVEQNKELSNVARRYAQALFTQVAQTAACNRLHPIMARFARWLLLSQDRVEADTVRLTHEFIATMLGARRASVTLAAGTLQDAGIINYKRGALTILDRARLEEISCECHRIVQDEYERLLGRRSLRRRSNSGSLTGRS